MAQRQEQAELNRYQTVRESFIRGQFSTPPLPELVVDQIIDSAEYWNWVSAETRENTSVSNGRKAYLSIEVPAACRKVKMVALECESHDQGWSSYPNDQGTERNSWTWGDLSVLNAEGHEEFKKDRVYTNIHACRDWEMQKCEFGEAEPLTKQLRPGKKLVLSINALFPGWVNHIRYCKLTVYFI